MEIIVLGACIGALVGAMASTTPEGERINEKLNEGLDKFKELSDTLKRWGTDTYRRC